MSVQTDGAGRRFVASEVEVPGTPEEVWRAMATGPGISSWFVPTEVEERVGGAVVTHFGPDASMDSRATVTVWEPPHRFSAEGPGFTPDAPPLATEWTVEARAGGTCVVRVVHSMVTTSDAWDERLAEIDWSDFFRILRIYLTHFNGQPNATVQLMGAAPEPKARAWQALTAPLGLAGVVAGQRVSAPADAPPFAGVVERAGPPEWPETLLLRLDEPAPGIAHIYVQPTGGQVYLTLRFFLFGDQAAAAQAEPRWQSWMSARFPMPSEAA